jgi:hypothetical protein
MLRVERSLEAGIADLDLWANGALVLFVAVKEVVRAQTQAAAASEALRSDLSTDPV